MENKLGNIKSEIYTHIFSDSSEGVTCHSWNDALEYLDNEPSNYAGTFHRSEDGKTVEFLDMQNYLPAYREEQSTEIRHYRLLKAAPLYSAGVL